MRRCVSDASALAEPSFGDSIPPRSACSASLRVCRRLLPLGTGPSADPVSRHHPNFACSDMSWAPILDSLRNGCPNSTIQKCGWKTPTSLGQTWDEIHVSRFAKTRVLPDPAVYQCLSLPPNLWFQSHRWGTEVHREYLLSTKLLLTYFKPITSSIFQPDAAMVGSQSLVLKQGVWNH